MSFLRITDKNNLKGTPGWSIQDFPSTAIIRAVEDQIQVDVSQITTSVPSPFARLYLIDTAFSFAIGNKVKNGYTSLVADTFDFLEFMLNFNQHHSSQFDLKCEQIGPDDFKFIGDADIANDNEKVANQINGTLALFYEQDFKNFSNPLTLISVRENKPGEGETDKSWQTVAITSPFTVVCVAQNISNIIKGVKMPKQRRVYFSGVLDFNERSESARRYFLYLANSIQLQHGNDNPFINFSNFVNEFFGGNDYSSLYSEKELEWLRIDDHDLTVCGIKLAVGTKIDRSRIRMLKPEGPILVEQNRDIYGEESKAWTWECSDSFNNRVIKGLDHNSKWICVDEFFEEKLIRLQGNTIIEANAVINRTYFYSPNDSSNFLLPLTPTFFQYFNINDIDAGGVKIIYETDLAKQAFTRVKLTLPLWQGGKQTSATFERTYYYEPDPLHPYSIVSLDIALIFYPFIEVHGWEKNRNYVMAVSKENTSIQLQHGSDQFISVKRSGEKDPLSTSIITLTETPTELFVIYKEGLGTPAIKGSIIPLWRKRTFDGDGVAPNVAIDLGTSNTHVIMDFDGALDVKNCALNWDKDSQENSPLIGLMSGGESAFGYKPNVDEELSMKLIPREVSSHGVISFPTKTVIYFNSDYNFVEDVPVNSIFQANIGFEYLKRVTPENTNSDANLKWGGNAKSQSRLKYYVYHLMFMIRSKILIQKKSLSKTQIIYFTPSSMPQRIIINMASYWNSAYSFYIGDTSNRVQKISESISPLKYLLSKDTSNSAVTLANCAILCDIGGGSTDACIIKTVVDENGSTANVGISTSFRFAGNILWSYEAFERDFGDIEYKMVESLCLGDYYDSLEASIANISDTYRKDFINGLLTKYHRIVLEKSGKAQFYKEFMNFVFDVTEKYQLTNYNDKLRQDTKLLFVILFHFSAILFHLLQVTRRNGQRKPEYIVFTGNASRAYSLIDSDSIKQFTQIFVSEYIKLTDSPGLNEWSQEKYELKIVFERLAKEATCLGGIHELRAGNNQQTQITDFVHQIIPEDKFNFLMAQGNKELVLNEVNLFINLFFTSYSEFKKNHRNTILADLNNQQTEKVKSEIINKMQMTYDNSLEHARILFENEDIRETPFFYPIKKMFLQISEVLYHD